MFGNALPFIFGKVLGQLYPSGFDPVNDKYVAKTGNDTTGDGSWGNPYLTIQKGIDEVADTYQVWVGAGTYAEHLTHSTAKSITIRSVTDNYDDVIINGGGTDRCLYVSSGGAGAQTMRGLTFYNGYHADGGGGVYVYSSAGLTGIDFYNCKFDSNNSAWGAGLDLSAGTTRTNHLTLCLFTGNVASTGDGGALFHNNGTMILDQCTFTGNRAGTGAGDYASCIYFAGIANASVTNSVFYDNKVGVSSSNTLYGCLHIISCSGNFTLRDCLFYDNMQEYNGIFTYDGSVAGTITIDHITAVDNRNDASATDGGFLTVEGSSSLTIKNSIIYNNLNNAGSLLDFYETLGSTLTVNYCFTTDQWGGAGANNLDELTSGKVVGFTDYAGNDFTINPATSDCYQAADDGGDIGTRYFTILT